MDSSDDEGIIVKHKSGKKNIFNDSDDEELVSTSKPLFTSLKDNDLYDAEDSDDESQNPQTTDDDRKKQSSKKNTLFEDDDSGDEGHGSMEDKNEPEPEPVPAFQRLLQSDLYDADDSEDDNRSVHRDSYDDAPVSKSSFNISRNDDDREKTKKPKKREKSDRKSKANALQQIHSETQRLVRESRVSLPYHKPRQRTLAEFLQRRKKQLEERAKEAEEFYKSDSEDSITEDGNENSVVTDASKTEIIPVVNTVSETSVSCVNADKTEALNRVCKNLNSELSSVSDDNINKICVTSVDADGVQDKIKGSGTSVDADNDQNEDNVCITTDCDVNGKSVKPIENVEHDREENSESLINACKNLNAEFSNNSTMNKKSDDVQEKLENNESTPVCKNVNVESINNSTDNNVNEMGVAAIITEINVNTCDNSDNSQSKNCSAIDSENHSNSADKIETNSFADDVSKSTNPSVFDGIPKGVFSFSLQNSEDKTEMKPPDTTKVLKKMESFMIDENACIDGETARPSLMRVSSESNSENTNDGSRTVGDTCDFHLHYSESQSVPWYENIQPPTPEEEAEAEVDTEDKQLQTSEPPPSDNVTGDEIKDQEPDDKLKQLARRSLPGFGDITKLKPKLSGAPNEVINLDDEDDSTALKGGLMKLMQRFIKHSAKKHQPNKKEHVEIGVVTVDSQDFVQKDIVSITLDGDTPEEDPLLAKPGAKLQKLKEELQKQMSQRRSEEHRKRMKEKKVDSEELSDGSVYDELDEVDKLDEFEADIETETEEEEEEEEDMPIVEKKRVKSAFVEDEADVSDDCDGLSSDEDELANDPDGDGDNAANRSSALKQKVTTDDNDNDSNDTAEDESCNTILSTDKKVIPESVDIGGLSESVFGNDKSESKVNGSQNVSSLVSTQDVIKKSISELINTQDSISSKSSFDTGRKFMLESFNTQDSLCARLTIDADKMESAAEARGTQSDNTQMTRLGKVKTFDIFGSQEFDDLTPYQPQRLEPTPYSNRNANQKKRIWDFISPERCSQSGESSPVKENIATGSNMPRKLFTELEPEKSQNMDELLDLCSGQFSNSVGGLMEKEKAKSRTELEDELVNLCSGKFTTQPARSLTQDETLLAPLPAFSAIRKDSGNLSQDNSSRPAKTENDADDKLIGYDSDGNEVEVDYDSEENEVPRAKRAKEFFENEAELSESEWGSADEDEQNLDTMEWEAGDDDALDQHKVKEQLNKIHM
ncbi:hypothetical protein C0J52_17196 [Blattella germanica]|nr:hypothetical protein C0J52_17196 [Blattella germanica]